MKHLIPSVVVFAEKIRARGRTHLNVLPAPILGDIYVRAARMRGERSVQILWADGSPMARHDLARALRAFLVATDGMFVEEEPLHRIRPEKWREDVSPRFGTPSFRDSDDSSLDPSRGLAMLASWCDRNGEDFHEWIDSPVGSFILPMFKGSVERGEAKPWEAAFEAACPVGFQGVPSRSPLRALPLGHLRAVPSRACADGLFPIDLLSGGIRARNYLEHLDPQWLRLELAAWFRGNDRDWDIDIEKFIKEGRATAHRRLALPAQRSIPPLRRFFGGEIGQPDKEGLEMLDEARARAMKVAAAYSEWRFADAVKGACEIAGLGNVFVFMRAPWNRPNDATTQGEYSACLLAFRIAAICLAPVLPEFASRVARLFGEAEYTFDAIDRVPGGRLAPSWPPLFPTLAADSFAAMVNDALAESAAVATGETPPNREFMLYYK